MRVRRFVSRATIIWALASLMGCAPETSGPDAPEDVHSASFALEAMPIAKTSLYVEVFDAVKVPDTEKNPIQGATVRIVERAGLTDEGGRVLLDNLIPGETMVTVRAPDYVRMTMNTKLDQVHAAMKVHLKKRDFIKQTSAKDKFSIDGPGGVKIEIPQGALVDPFGYLAKGDVNVYITRFNPTTELGLLPTPPSLLDKETRAHQPIQVANLVAIEIEQIEQGEGVPLSLKEGATMTVTMPIAPIVQTNKTLQGFAQDKHTGRWEISSAGETITNSPGTGEPIWSAKVSRLGLIAPGLLVDAPRKITVRVDSEYMTTTNPGVGVMVRATSTRSASVGFTGPNGEATLYVPTDVVFKLGIPSLEGPNDKFDESHPSNDLYILTAKGTNCQTAGGLDTDQCFVDARYCDGFFWSKAKPRAKLPYELWNGIDDDCNEKVDDKPLDIGWRCDTGQKGLCAFGIIAWSKDLKDPKKDPTLVCTQRVKLTDELPDNGLDDDCDGRTDEPCDGLEKTDCYAGPEGTLGVGVCTGGTKTCDASEQWGPCVDEVLPSADLPKDNKDNDCDGDTNEECTIGESKACSSKPDIGECKSGTRKCDANKQWGACVGKVGPAPEVCDGKDNDCNGAVDNGNPGGGASCDTGKSGPCATGSTVCAKGTITCKQTVFPAVEACDSIDNDCNGQTDEELGSTSCGVGACQATVQNCENGKTNTCSPGTPATETCDGIDNNCNGTVDDGNPGGGGACTTLNLGACAAGTLQCTGGKLDCAQTTQSSPEVCDGIDNDCDGNVDDGNPGGNVNCTAAGQAGECSKGKTTCSAGSITCTPAAPNAEICDGLDNNCNGTVDENNPGSGGSCAVAGQQGPCAQGAFTCTAGALVCTQTVQPTAEVCNNIDDNCNGQTDEDPLCTNACLASCIGGTPDGTCVAGENSFNCAQDCACGDGICSDGETPQSCHVDCKFSNDTNGMCGNGYCDPWEVNYATKTVHCPQDCGNGVAGFVCGDGNCANQETATNCAADCGNLTTYVVGNNICEADEHWSTSVDCDPLHINAGTFLKAECQGYALVETYADGQGSTTSHTVTNCSESCGASPWKLIANNVYPGNNTFNGVQLLRPDCSICTLANTQVNIVGDQYGGGYGTQYGVGWVDMYQQTEYDMNVDPNTCHHAAYRDAYPYSPYNVFYGYLFPVEWEKTGEKYCSPGTCSNVRDCDGNPYAPESGTVGTWKPAFAPWSKLAAEYCP